MKRKFENDNIQKQWDSLSTAQQEVIEAFADSDSDVLDPKNRSVAALQRAGILSRCGDVNGEPTYEVGPAGGALFAALYSQE